ncbi:MAG: adenylosuccinate lyase [Armatimonadetes bacterium RBG_16_58_9]|nr:MAG: adenylosuccinate lyase [Armatimonadetes bacterium RBG_16_58_9]
MIDRYSLPEMKAIWSEQNKFQSWLDVEIAVCEAQEHFGNIPAGTSEKVKSSAKFTIERIEEIECETHHDLVAFVKAVTENLGEEGRYVHYGVTSYDIEDTAMALRMRAACDVIIEDLEKLAEMIARLAREHKMTPMIGRTHGVHAEPITFGFKMAVWYSQFQRDIDRMRSSREVISVGKISGAVGIFGNIDLRIEEFVCERLGLVPAPVSTQIIQRDRHAAVLLRLAIAASTCEGLATEMRNLQRTEILEVQEMFLPGQRGSSAMPHKRNPWRFETICGLARVVRSNAIPAMENITSWHERDLTNSAAERIIIPDSFLATDFMLQSLAKLLDRLEVNESNMRRNLEMMGQLVFSEHVMLALIQKGTNREEAYKICQRNAAKCWDEDISFRQALEKDEDVTSRLSGGEFDECFDLEHHLRNVEAVFKRLGLV